jgi:hypothetical protein
MTRRTKRVKFGASRLSRVWLLVPPNLAFTFQNIKFAPRSYHINGKKKEKEELNKTLRTRKRPRLRHSHRKTLLSMSAETEYSTTIPLKKGQ